MAFPDGFLWGTATAAHQVEGGNSANDIWFLEHLPRTIFREPSGDAVEHYRLFRDDIALLARLGFTAYRFSVEWARIEPEPGVWDAAAGATSSRPLDRAGDPRESPPMAASAASSAAVRGST